ncbi:MAG: HAMP domain-containing sensor histidine kinase [Daejeonella sp.]|uniref:sensor histidine kinase n=1 Tax=Daejeonella sp. TaxID=2805397 RepID=UPI003C7132A8
MLLNLIGELHNKVNRFQAACRLAGYFDCSHLIIFIQDPEIPQLLPAPGFPQTLPNWIGWNNFLKECLKKSFHSGTLAFQDFKHPLLASGISGSDGSVVVLLGGTLKEDALAPLRDILPIFTELFKLEQAAITSEIRVNLAQKSAEKAEKLARTIELMRMQLMEALGRKEKHKREIEELMKKKDEFMNVASHELKTPITNMKGYLQILKKAIMKENGSSVDLLDKADNQVNKLTGLVNDLLDVTKIQAGQMIYHFSDLDISTVLTDVVSQSQFALHTHKITIENNPAIIVRGEKSRLEQVLTNLLSNAVKYSPNNDIIILNTVLIGDVVRISVKDFGIGIPAENQKHIFNKFYRGKESSQQFSGLGLGLYISSEIIRRHGGTIGVSSDTGGSEFYFFLPVATKNGLPMNNEEEALGN